MLTSSSQVLQRAAGSEMMLLDNRRLLLCLQVPGSVLKQMPPPSGSMGGVGGMGGVTGGGVFPPQLSPQHIAMLSSIYPPHIQLQLVRNSFVIKTTLPLCKNTLKCFILNELFLIGLFIEMGPYNFFPADNRYFPCNCSQ